MADWTELPKCLLESCLKRLNFVGDFARFRCVCNEWRKVHIECESGHHLPPHLPGLYLPGNGTFFPLTNNPMISSLCEIPPEGHRIVGAFDSWVVILDRRLDAFLLNPFSSHKIQLPSLNTLPEIVDFRETETGTIEHTYIRKSTLNFTDTTTSHRLLDFYIIKVVLSGDPASSPDFISLGIGGERGDLVFCKSGDDKWTSVPNQKWSFDDIVYYQDKFIGVTNNTLLVIFDIGPPPLHTQFASVPDSVDPDANPCKKYLVDSAGELLLVIRMRTDNAYDLPPENEPYKTFWFKVFKVDPNGPSCSRLNSLGDQALFLGINTSLSLSAREFEGCKANHIYFTDDNLEGSYKQPYGGHDIGVFNLEDGTVRATLSERLSKDLATTHLDYTQALANYVNHKRKAG